MVVAAQNSWSAADYIFFHLELWPKAIDRGPQALPHFSLDKIGAVSLY